MSVELHELPPTTGLLAGARPSVDLAAVGYRETEYVVSGTAVSYVGDQPADGRWSLRPGPEAGFVTRAVLRAPESPATGSGTLVVEWLNVSSGMDSCPDWTYAAEEVIRRGHAWLGVSAQYAGVEGGLASVQIEGMELPGLKGSDPDRYGDLRHPGDAFAYDIYTRAASAFRELLGAGTVLAVGESQSAALLTTYVNGVQPLVGLFDGFLLHSRLAVAAPLDVRGTGIRMDAAVRSHPVTIRDDQPVPVLLVQAEGDLFDRIGYLPARQPDGDAVRLWEVAGSAHADRYLIDEIEPLLGCPVPVNRGQQGFVVRAALWHLQRWARGGDAPPYADRLEVQGDDFRRDPDGNVLGGVRTPAVEAAVERLSGRPWPGAPSSCRLFGSTTPVPAARLRERYGDHPGYLAAYEKATDGAIAAGFLLADDRAAILLEARPAAVLSD